MAPNTKNETTSKALVRFDQVDSPEDAGGSSGESSAQLVFAAENRQNQNHHQLQGRVNILHSPVHTRSHMKVRRSKIKAVGTFKVVELTHRNGQHADVEERFVHRGVTW